MFNEIIYSNLLINCFVKVVYNCNPKQSIQSNVLYLYIDCIEMSPSGGIVSVNNFHCQDDCEILSHCTVIQSTNKSQHSSEICCNVHRIIYSRFL